MEDVLAEDWILFDPTPSDPNARAKWQRPRPCQNRVTFRKLCTNTYCLAMALILFAVWVLFFLSRLEVLV